MIFGSVFKILDESLRAFWHLWRPVLAIEPCVSHSIGARRTSMSSVCSIYHLDTIKRARKTCVLKMHWMCCIGAVHLLQSLDVHQSSWSSTRMPSICRSQMKGKVSLFHLDVISDRRKKKKKTVCWGEPAHTLSLAKRLVEIHYLKSEGVRCVCTSGSLIKCLFMFSGT